MKDKKHIFFDLDRTLWDFNTNSQEALHEIYNEKNLDIELGTFQSFLSVYEKINEECWRFYRMGSLKKEVLRVKRFRDTFTVLGFPNEEIVNFFADEYVKRSPFKKNLLPGTIENLTYLSNQGFILHIITNGFKEIQHVKLKNSEIDHFFDVVLCSEETGAKKPDAKVFLTAIQKARTKNSDAIMIGDDWEADVLGGLKSGMHPIWFNPDQHDTPDQNIVSIHHLNELQNIL